MTWLSSEHPWSLWIWTSDIPSAGTDAEISFQVYGQKGKSDEIRLDNKTDNFEQGQVDRFMVRGLSYNSVPRTYYHPLCQIRTLCRKLLISWCVFAGRAAGFGKIDQIPYLAWEEKSFCRMASQQGEEISYLILVYCKYIYQIILIPFLTLLSDYKAKVVFEFIFMKCLKPSFFCPPLQ